MTDKTLRESREELALLRRGYLSLIDKALVQAVLENDGEWAESLAQEKIALTDHQK